MPPIPLGVSARKRKTTWTPHIRVVNYLAEKNETNAIDGIDHVQRPGEVLFCDLNAGRIWGLFRRAGTFNGDFLAVSATTLFRVTQAGVATSLGSLPGNERNTFAATATRALITSNGIVYSTSGGAITTVVMPDGRLVDSVAELNGYFILTERDSNRYYWIEPGQTNPDALSFASTESSPGSIVKVERVGDELWFLKEEGTEVHIPTGNADLPFQRVPGRNYDKGARSRDAVCRFDNSVGFVGNDGLVYRGDASPQRISDNSIEEQVRKSLVEDLVMWSFASDGHTVLCLTTTYATLVYDASTQQWTDFKTYGRDTWRCHVGDSADTFTVAGSDEDGILYRLDPEVSNDDGLPMERIVTGGVSSTGQRVPCDNLILYATAGTSSDPNAYPKVRIRWSDDLQTYSDWKEVSIGRQGQYARPIVLNRLGQIAYPGRLFEFVCTDDCVLTIGGAAINEPLA